MSVIYQDGGLNLDELLFKPLYEWFSEGLYEWFEKQNRYPFEEFRREVLEYGPPKTKSGDIHYDRGYVFHMFVMWANEEFANATGMATRPYATRTVLFYHYPISVATIPEGDVVVTMKTGPVSVREIVSYEQGPVIAKDDKGNKLLELDSVYFLQTPSSRTAIGVENTIEPTQSASDRFERKREFLRNLFARASSPLPFTEPYTLKIRLATDGESPSFYNIVHPQHRKLVVPRREEIWQIERELYGRM